MPAQASWEAIGLCYYITLWSNLAAWDSGTYLAAYIMYRSNGPTVAHCMFAGNCFDDHTSFLRHQFPARSPDTCVFGVSNKVIMMYVSWSLVVFTCVHRCYIAFSSPVRTTGSTNDGRGSFYLFCHLKRWITMKTFTYIHKCINHFTRRRPTFWETRSVPL